MNINERVNKIESELGELSGDEMNLVLEMLGQGYSVEEIIAAIIANRNRRRERGG